MFLSSICIQDKHSLLLFSTQVLHLQVRDTFLKNLLFVSTFSRKTAEYIISYYTSFRFSSFINTHFNSLVPSFERKFNRVQNSCSKVNAEEWKIIFLIVKHSSTLLILSRLFIKNYPCSIYE